MLERQAISRPVGHFSKKLTYVCSSALNNEVSGEKMHLIWKTAAPQQFCQELAEIVENCTFLFFWLGHRCHWDEVQFLLGESIVQRRTTNVSEIFWKIIQRGEVWGPHIGASGQRRWKSRVRDCSKGQKKPNFLNNFSDSKFNLNSDFAVKHDPTQCFDQGMGIWS